MKTNPNGFKIHNQSRVATLVKNNSYREMFYAFFFD